MRRIAYALLVCLILASGFVVARASIDYQRVMASRRHRTVPAVEERYRLEWKWRTEQEWIVADIVGALDNMAAFARTARAPGDGVVAVREVAVAERLPLLAQFEARPPSGDSLTIDIVNDIWDPAAYAPHASRLAGGLQGGCATANDGTLLVSLGTRGVDRLIAENNRISARLQREVRCGLAHEEAALLLGTFALREAASGFSDPRRLMSRMTAHLAMARALAVAEPTPAGRVASAILLTLEGLQQRALATLDALTGDRSTAGLQAWIRALRMRNTGDWRVLEKPADATWIEQLELVRAMERSLGDQEALAVAMTLDDGAAVEWPRLLLQHPSSVDAGNRYTDDAVGRELHELAQAAASFGISLPRDREDLLPALNGDPAPGPVTAAPAPVVRVLDWSTWAAATQRHLLMEIVSKTWHLAAVLGSKSDAEEFRAYAGKHFAALRLFPLAARYTGGGKAEYDGAMAGAIEICRTRPDLVTDAVWKRLLEKTADGPVPDAMPPAVGWFSPFIPAGTAFEAGWRAFAINQLPRLEYRDLKVLRERAPFVRELIDGAMKYHAQAGAMKYHGRERVAFDDLQTEYGGIADYDVRAARKIADAAWGDPPKYIELMERLAKLKPDVLADLGSYLVDRGRDQDARLVYERYVAEAHNRVGVSARTWWLVRYYFLKGQFARATALADAAADVYSYLGLITRADLYDWRGDTVKAEAVYRQAAERYDSQTELAAFYLRHGRKGAEVERAVRAVFPNGLTRVNLPAMLQAPADGVELTAVGCAGERNGVRIGDVVVAVDGIRVQDYEQYRVARGASAGDAMRLCVWRNGRYLDVQTRLREVWTESYLKNYVVQR